MAENIVQAQPTEIRSQPERHWLKIALFSISVLVLAVGLVLAGVWVGRKQRQPTPITTQPVATPTFLSDFSLIGFPKIAFVKDGDIYLTDTRGQVIVKLFKTENEELVRPRYWRMKFSPDGKYLAYLGTSGGLDSAIKMIDVSLKKKIFQDVYGSAYITDFAWSPDSQKLVVAVNLKNNDQNFTTSLYLVNPFIEKEPLDLLFEPENIEITQVEWSEKKYIYYSRLSHAKESAGKAGLVVFNTETGGRKAKDLTYWATASFFFAVSPAKDKAFFWTFPNFAPPPDPYFRILSLPGLEELTSEINLGGNAQGVKWIENYLVGISMPYGSPDQNIFLYDLLNDQIQSLLDIGPSGTFQSVDLLKEDGKMILLVWSEFDQIHSISAHDLEELIEAREKMEVGKPLWTLKDSYSPNE